MSLVFCTKPEHHTDTSLYCFVDPESGKHVSPRACTCLMVRGSDGLSAYVPTGDQKRRYASAAMPNDEFFSQMRKKFGKRNPDCPITDPHEPIDPRVCKSFDATTKRAK